MNTEKLNIDDLYKQHKKTSDFKFKTYNQILKRVHSKIKLESRQRNTANFIFYTIPEFILGMPRYDCAACTAFIIDELNKNGFITKYTHPNLLFISWNHYIPYYKRMEYKKKTGKSIDGFGNIVKKKYSDHNNNNNNNNSSISNPNELMFKKMGKKMDIKKKPDHNYKNTDTYKPSGNLIYSTDLIKRITDRTS